MPESIRTVLESKRQELETLEIQLLLTGVYRYYGFDFRDYARASMRRRVWAAVREEGVQSISGLQERLLHDERAMHRFLERLSGSAAPMFRDPGFYRAFREKVVPRLKGYPSSRI
jgi:chemotaxis protein methyltransferase CheR